MELDQLVQNAYMRNKPAFIQPFDMEILGQAFQLRETAPVDLPSVRFSIIHFPYDVIEFVYCAAFNIYCTNRLKRVYLLFLVNQKVSPRTKRRNIKNTKTKTGIKIRSIRSINIGIKTGVRIKIKTRTKIRKRIKVGIMILVAIIQRSIMIRLVRFLFVENSNNSKVVFIVSNYIPYGVQCPWTVSEEEA